MRGALTPIDLFLERLTNETPREWVVDDGAIRILSGPDQECPISAVVNAGKGLVSGDINPAFVDPLLHSYAAGLSHNEAREVRDASDNLHPAPGLGRSTLRERDHRALRDRILVACGKEKGL